MGAVIQKSGNLLVFKSNQGVLCLCWAGTSSPVSCRTATHPGFPASSGIATKYTVHFDVKITQMHSSRWRQENWFSSVQSLSRVRLFATPCTAVRQASLSIASSRSLLKLMSIELVMPSNHFILYRPLLLLPSILPSIRVFSNESVLRIGGQSIGVSASASVLPMNIQD